MRIVVFLSMWGAVHLNGLEFRDAKGQMDLIPGHLIDVFCESEQGQALHEDVKEGLLIDFSGRGLPCLEGRYIKQVLQYAHNVKDLTKKEVTPDETQLLDTANYLGVKQKEVLYHLANRVWGYLRTGKKMQEFPLSESDEAYVRKIAKPYLNSPERLMRVNKKWFSGERKNGFTCFDFSFKMLQQSYDQEYPFGLSYGLADMIHNLCISSHYCGKKDYNISIDLTGHSIKEFIIDDWIQKESDKRAKQSPKITVWLNLADNNVERIGWSKMPSRLVYEKLNFSGNPVISLDESLYMLAYSYRSQGLPSELIIPHNKLSIAEIALAKRQWYLAANTFLDRYSRGYNPDVVPVIIACLIIAASGTYDRFFDKKGLALLEGIIGGVVVWLIIHSCYLPRLAHAIAVKTHPDIEKPRADFHKPLGNTWLEDWQKPQLILK